MATHDCAEEEGVVSRRFDKWLLRGSVWHSVTDSDVFLQHRAAWLFLKLGANKVIGQTVGLDSATLNSTETSAKMRCLAKTFSAARKTSCREN